MGQDQSKQNEQNTNILKDNANIPNTLQIGTNMKDFDQIDPNLINVHKQKFSGQSISYTCSKANKENFKSPKSSDHVLNITTPNQSKSDKVLNENLKYHI